MKKLLTILLLMGACAGLRAANAFNTITLTFTNIPTNGCTFIISGTTVRWTNAPQNNTAWIQTNGIAGSTTNMVRRLGAQWPQFRTIQTNGTNLIISGSGVTLGMLGNYGFLTTNSLANNTNRWLVDLPWDYNFETNRTNTADELIYGLNKYARTNAFGQSAQAMTNFVSRTNAQEVLNKTIGASLFTNGTVDFSVLTNIPRANIGVLIGTNFYAFSGVVSNVDLINVLSLSGIATALTNGTLYGTSATNGPWGSFTNLVALKSFAATNAILDRPRFTNAVGSYIDGVFASENTGVIITNGSSLEPTLTFHQSDSGGNTQIGFYYAGQFVWGIDSSTNELNITSAAKNFISLNLTSGVVHLGDSELTVVPLAPIVGGVLTNTAFAGTNVWNGDVAFTAGTYSSLVNSPGENKNIDIPTNRVIRFSGGSAIADIHSFAARFEGLEFDAEFTGAITNRLIHNSGAEGATARRLHSPTGGDIIQTNQPATATFRKRSGDWLIVRWSN